MVTPFKIYARTMHLTSGLVLMGVLLNPIQVSAQHVLDEVMVAPVDEERVRWVIPADAVSVYRQQVDGYVREETDGSSEFLQIHLPVARAERTRRVKILLAEPTVIPGTVKTIDAWLSCDRDTAIGVRAVLTDFHGIEYKISLAHEMVTGWRRYSLAVPGQIARTAPDRAQRGLTFHGLELVIGPGTAHAVELGIDAITAVSDQGGAAYRDADMIPNPW